MPKYFYHFNPDTLTYEKVKLTVALRWRSFSCG